MAMETPVAMDPGSRAAPIVGHLRRPHLTPGALPQRRQRRWRRGPRQGRGNVQGLEAASVLEDGEHLRNSGDLEMKTVKDGENLWKLWGFGNEQL